MNKLETPRIVHFDYRVEASIIMVKCKEFPIEFDIPEGEEMKETCEARLIDECQRLYDFLAVPEMDGEGFYTPSDLQEQIASDVLQGDYRIVLQLQR